MGRSIIEAGSIAITQRPWMATFAKETDISLAEARRVCRSCEIRGMCTRFGEDGRATVDLKKGGFDAKVTLDKADCGAGESVAWWDGGDSPGITLG